jgi:hypothetical protein
VKHSRDPTVIASEAKQSIPQYESKNGLLRRSAPRNDVAPILDIRSHSRRAMRPSCA